jgi:hypothetical protein
MIIINPCYETQCINMDSVTNNRKIKWWKTEHNYSLISLININAKILN